MPASTARSSRFSSLLTFIVFNLAPVRYRNVKSFASIDRFMLLDAPVCFPLEQIGTVAASRSNKRIREAILDEVFKPGDHLWSSTWRRNSRSAGPRPRGAPCLEKEGTVVMEPFKALVLDSSPSQPTYYNGLTEYAENAVITDTSKIPAFYQPTKAFLATSKSCFSESSCLCIPLSRPRILRSALRCLHP
jgi:hypothetical protein